MTSAQLRLPGIEPARQVRPTAERAAPAFWLRRLRVLRELTSGGENVLRDVVLRRGLNIIWAPPQAAGADNALFRDGVAGHTAGKSSFCRLVRHVLGERGFAPDSVKRRIRSRLPTAWVVADVMISDVSWIVARPLGIGPRSFCLRGEIIEAVADAKERLEYQLFLQALAQSTTERLDASRFPTSDEAVRWEHVLPWLARDQECRFADFLEWRHSSSGSEAPALNVDERQFIVRSLLGLITQAEQVEQRTNARLVAEKKDATRVEPLLRNQAETDHARLTAALGKDLPLASAPLFGTAARTELARRQEELVAREKALAEGDRREDLRTALEDANRHEGELKKSLEDAESRFALASSTVSALTGNGQSSLLAALPPARDFCNIPLHVAHESGCPLAVGRPLDLQTRRSERTAAEELAVQQQLFAALEQEVGKFRAAVGAAAVETLDARRSYLSASTEYEQGRSKRQAEREALKRIDDLVDAAERGVRAAAGKADAIEQLGREIDESYARQGEIRDGQQAAMERFSSTFDYVVRAIIGDRVVGRVDPSGRSLALTVEEHGERDSAAIATIKLLAFDLAAVVTSIEGNGSFPRFLIHDGPREADMEHDIYERFFLFALELEKCFVGEPAFQYVVTTTTKPPDRLVGPPWLVLQLAGMPAEERLLRCDL